MRWQSLLLIVGFAACSGKDGKDEPGDGNIPDDGDADTDADSDSDTDVDCTASIASITPLDGDTLVPIDATVTATFDVAITAADTFGIELDAAAGTTELAADGLSMTWVGTLAPETPYVVTASVCDTSDTSTFTTLPPALDLSALDGNTYALPWENITINEPGNDGALNLLIDVPFVLAQIVAVDEVSLLADAVGTTGSDTMAPDCDNAVLQTADFTLNPYFRIEGTIAIPIDADGNTTNVEEFSLLAKMEADGQSITDVRISGLIATEDILAGADCNSAIVGALDPECRPCTASATGQCLLFEGTAPLALLQPTIDIALTCGL